MLFTCFMRRRIYLYGLLIIPVVVVWLFSGTPATDHEFSEKVKVSLREVGDQLLRSNKDSTSLVLPVIELERSKYELSFEKDLSFDPASLVMAVDSSFRRAKLAENYRVEVIQCTDKEVAYSYEMNTGVERTLIPCRGRLLPERCYTITVQYTEQNNEDSRYNWLLYILLFIGLLALIDFFLYTKNRTRPPNEGDDTFATIGSFQFYPEQNKLVKAATEISLSRKECELLAIFVANPNQIIKRDELTKKVWEDKGVIVGRSLDTYISKLRKKLQEDDAIKLTNVHGVGYKLEIKR